MTITVVQADVQVGVLTTTVTSTLGSTPTTGNTIVAIGSAIQTPGTLSISGSGWTELAGSPLTTSGTDATSAIWVKSADATTSYTVTSSATDYLGFVLMEVDIPYGLLLVDAGPVQGEYASGTQCPYGSIAPSESESITIISVTTHSVPGGSGHTFPAGFSNVDTKSNRRTNAVYKVGAAGTYSGNITWTNTVNYSQTVSLSLAISTATGTAAVGLESVIPTASGNHGSDSTGTVAVVLEDTTSTTTAGHGAAGTIDITLEDVTSDVVSGHGLSGTITITLDDITSDAAGLFSENIIGSGDVTLDDAVAAFAGTFPFSGLVASSLEDVISTATGTQTVAGDGSIVLDDVTNEIVGSIPLSGFANIELMSVTSDTIGEADDRVNVLISVNRGTIAIARATVARRKTASGSVHLTLESVSSTVVATHVVVGVLEAILSDATASITGDFPFAGTVDVTLDDFTATASGGGVFSGTIEATLVNVEASGAGDSHPAGIVSATVDNVVSESEGSATSVGDGAATLDNITSVIVGKRGNSGLIVATLQPVTAFTVGSGAQGPTGVHDPTAKSVQEYKHGWGMHIAGNSGLRDQWRSNSGLPGTLRNLYVGAFCNGSNSAASLAPILAVLNESANERIRLGFHGWPGGVYLRGSKTYQQCIDKMNDVANGDWDTGLTNFANALNAFTDNQLKRVILCFQHEVPGGFFFYGATRGDDVDTATDTLLAAAHKAQRQHVTDTINGVLDDRAGYVTWEYNLWGTFDTRYQDYAEDSWPGDSRVDAVTFDKYAGPAIASAPASNRLMVTQLDTMVTHLDTFCNLHSNKLRGIGETACKQSWGTAGKPNNRDFTDRQTVQIEFFQAMHDASEIWYNNGVWMGNFLFEKSIGTPTGGPDAYGTDEAACYRIFNTRAEALGSVRDTTAWRANPTGTQAYYCNFPLVAEALQDMILSV